MSAETLVRPNGKTYRPRGPMKALAVEDQIGTVTVVVFGTHDSARAFPLADQVWAQEGCDGALAPNGDPTWMREVPWDAHGGFDHSVIRDDTRGRAALVFGAL